MNKNANNNRKEANIRSSDRTDRNLPAPFIKHNRFGQSLKKLLLLTSLVCIVGCAYSPVVDTAGRSGTFPEDKAKEITNDLQHCKMLADHNSSFLGNIIFWIESPTAETQHESIYRKCLTNRGHSVLH